ncbi:hypothetical protein [Spongorhabdus nitratireducens]
MDSIFFQSLLVVTGIVILLVWGLLLMVQGIGFGVLVLIQISRDYLSAVSIAARISITSR